MLRLSFRKWGLPKRLEGVAHTHPEPLNQLDQLNKIAIRRKNAPWLEELRS